MRIFFIFLSIFVILFVVKYSEAIEGNCNVTGEINSGFFCNSTGQWQALKILREPCENDYECESEKCVGKKCLRAKDILKEYLKRGIPSPPGNYSEVDTDRDGIPDYIELLIGSNPNDPNDPINNKPADDKSSPGNSRGNYIRSAPSTPKSMTKNFNGLIKNGLNKFEASHMYVPVSALSFRTHKSFKRAKLIIEKLDSVPVPSPKGKVYSYLSINLEDVMDTELFDGVITFWVENSWLKQNNINENTVILQRYTNKWEALPISISSRDDVKSYYTSVLPGFSYFAITSKVSAAAFVAPPAKKEVPLQPQYTPICGNDVIDAGENCENCPTDIKCLDTETCMSGMCIEKPKKIKTWPFLLIGGLILIIVLFVYKKIKKAREMGNTEISI